MRVTVTAVPSTEPAATLSAVAPPASAPFSSVTGMATANGAPSSTFARTWPVPTFSTVTVSCSGSVEIEVYQRRQAGEQPGGERIQSVV